MKSVRKKTILQTLPIIAGGIFLIILILLSISGCSQKRDDFKGMYPREELREAMRGQGGFNRTGFNETEMRERSVEMEKLMSESCIGKSEGESCLMQTPRGEITATCKMNDDKLLCQMEKKQMLQDGMPRMPSDDAL
ncbi:MAG: hypothetical protein PHO02_03340 [Candidatus Nanoarchaeia archaeon]|nr:hypothetical protein [Candidatus Nanoarchaeia archaeon]